MNFSVMEVMSLIMIGILILLLFKLYLGEKNSEGELESSRKELKKATELLNQKDSEFSSYKKNVVFERNLIAEGFVKSLFVLENAPKFPKGYDCSDFVVLNVEPLVFKNINISLEAAKKEENNFAKIIGVLITFAKLKNDLTSKKPNLEEIEKLRPEVYYSYKVFSKLDKKEMIVREEYLESLIQGKKTETEKQN